MAQLLGNVAVGQTVYLKENGTPQPYLVVHQGLPSSLYDASCNGTWLLRTNIYNKEQWNSTNNNTFTSATVNTTYLPGLLSMYDADIQSVIKTVKIPYCVGGGNTTVNSSASGFSCQLFLLSGYEVGWTQSDSQYFPADGAALSYFQGTATTDSKRVAYLNGVATGWWLRSQSTKNTSNAWYARSNGIYYNDNCTYSVGIRPAMIMPTNLLVLDDGSILTIGTPTITAPANAMQGQPIPVSWTAVDGADTYQLQRNTGSSWETIYTGANLSYEDTAGSWTTVQYQVAAGMGTDYGEYAQTASIPVISASALVISGTDGDLGTVINDIPYSISTDTGNQITATISVNSAVIFSGNVGNSTADVIPVLDLVSGTGTIVIEASVTATSGPVSAVRTWTYTKAAITFPDAGSVAQLTQEGANIWPKTLAECVRLPGGKTLDEVTAFPCQVYSGSYVGTGTWGESNPNTLTFGFEPKVVLISMWVNTTGLELGIFINPTTYAIRFNDVPSLSQTDTIGGGTMTVTWSENGMSWYDTDNAQLNKGGMTYNFVAIG